MTSVSRRAFLGVSGVGLAGSSAALLGACGGGGAAADVDDDTQGDIDLLNGALELELEAVAAYTQGAELLSGEALDFGKQFAAQEQEHADALEVVIEDLGGTPAGAKSAEEYATELSFDELKSADDVLELAVEIENEAIAAYNKAVAALSQPDLRRTVYAIVANEAQHLSVLYAELGEPPVPDAFVTGTPS